MEQIIEEKADVLEDYLGCEYTEYQILNEEGLIGFSIFDLELNSPSKILSYVDEFHFSRPELLFLSDLLSPENPTGEEIVMALTIFDSGTIELNPDFSELLDDYHHFWMGTIIGASRTLDYPCSLRTIELKENTKIKKICFIERSVNISSNIFSSLVLLLLSNLPENTLFVFPLAPSFPPDFQSEVRSQGFKSFTPNANFLWNLT